MCTHVQMAAVVPALKTACPTKKQESRYRPGHGRRWSPALPERVGCRPPTVFCLFIVGEAAHLLFSLFSSLRFFSSPHTDSSFLLYSLFALFSFTSHTAPLHLLLPFFANTRTGLFFLITPLSLLAGHSHSTTQWT
nr:hypothetical protein [Pandoravirus aubagnensis]